MRYNFQTILKKVPNVRAHPGFMWRGSDNFLAEGVMLHHTASHRRQSGFPSLHTVVNGRPRAGIPGPLCNLLISRPDSETAPATMVIASGRANHAGRGVPTALRYMKQNRWPMGNTDQKEPDVIPSYASYTTIGIEVEHTEGEPWTPAQYLYCVEVVAALHRHFGWSTPRIIGHREWTSRKVDPYYDGKVFVSMRAFRADVAKRLK